jgi:uncharacterized protein VirK/YbjX
MRTPTPTHRVWLALKRLMASCRILAYPSKLKRLWNLKFMGQYFVAPRRRDRFFFLTHKYYLSRYFSLAQRIDCAICHYGYEGRNRIPAYLRAVYHSPHGLTLWQQVANGVRCAITLRATEDNRHEGDLSVCCYVNDARVCRLSFSYIDCSVFGLPPQFTMFVTRNQTDQIPELQLFRDTFKQNSPPYFCIASVCGIAMANDMPAVYMVKADAQIAYEEKYAKSFSNSYSALWKGLGAQEIDGRHAYSMPIPLLLAPLSDVKHRRRATARRRNWLEIALCTRRTMLEQRVSRPLAPTEGEANDMLAPWDNQKSENAAQNQT